MLLITPANRFKPNEEDIQRLYELMVYAYEVTERQIWGPNYVRMFLDEYSQLLETDKILIAHFGEHIVGSIYHYPISENSYAFGLLNADFDESGEGIGRALIEGAELSAKEKGAEYMQLEILRPDDIHVPQKEKLKNWYQSMGYVFSRTGKFEELKPEKAEKAKKLVNPSSFDVYIKPLK